MIGLHGPTIMITAPKAILDVPPHEGAARYRELALKIEQSAGAAYTEETQGASYLDLARQRRTLLMMWMLTAKGNLRRKSGIAERAARNAVHAVYGEPCESGGSQPILPEERR